MESARRSREWVVMDGTDARGAALLAFPFPVSDLRFPAAA